MASDSVYSTVVAAVAAGVARTSDLNFASAASGLVSPDGTKAQFLNNNGVLVGSAGTNSGVNTLTDGTTITWDWSVGGDAQVTLAGNRTLAITNSTIGQRKVLKVIQDATGSRTLTYPTTTVKVATPLTTTASAADLLEFKMVDTALFWMISDTKNVS